MPEKETAERTTVTTTETEFHPDGATTTETVTTRAEMPNPDIPSHCRCDECVEFEEDLAERIGRIEEHLRGMGEKKESEPVVTQVRTTPEVQREREREKPSERKTPSSNGKKHAGFWI